jgi:glyoxylase-like metal-dependent hydrolase (beta-lactamase superfamily II)
MPVIIDPGQVPHPNNILEPLAALGESPASITDMIFSHHHPDHTLNAALFTFSGESALYLVYSL